MYAKPYIQNHKPSTQAQTISPSSSSFSLTFSAEASHFRAKVDFLVPKLWKSQLGRGPEPGKWVSKDYRVPPVDFVRCPLNNACYSVLKTSWSIPETTYSTQQGKCLCGPRLYMRIMAKRKVSCSCAFLPNLNILTHRPYARNPEQQEYTNPKNAQIANI